MKERIEEAARLVASARRIAAFSGAGISQESGIPTYRGSDGMWKEYDPQKYANISFFKKDPTYFWSFFRDVRYRTLVDSSPNEGHRALARLESAGKLRAVITQNIDGLHQAAGSENVIELHGNTRIIGCLRCGAEYGYEPIAARVKGGEVPPLCEACEGLLKPKVTFFGEALPQGAMESAAHESSNCDLMIVVGSTLEVFPAASCPLIAKRAGAKLIIVNVGKTAMDEIADVRIDGKAGEMLPQIV